MYTNTCIKFACIHKNGERESQSTRMFLLCSRFLKSIWISGSLLVMCRSLFNSVLVSFGGMQVSLGSVEVSFGSVLVSFDSV